MPPNTSLSAVTSTSIPSLNRRERSNTSPARSLSTLNAAAAVNTSFAVFHASNQVWYVPEQLKRQEVRLGEQEQPSRASASTLTKVPFLLSLGSTDKCSLKREANSPVYLDSNTVSVASSNNNSLEFNNHVTRRVVQCNSSRIRSSDSDVTSISSQDENAHFHNPRSKETGGEIAKNKSKNHGQRNKWTKEETEALVRGCNNFAIGQWKAIRDAEPLLAKRSPGDLKDRFRTYFPDAYRQHYPHAKTHISSRVRSVDSTGNSLFGENAIRRERRQFSAEEDAALKRGYIKFGTAWSSIQRDPVLASRKATDLRDRFRNAFPDLYAAAGYKPRSRKASGGNFHEMLLDPQHPRGTFEAIDLSIYPPHRFRANTHLYPDQHQLPSLDFLKEHGAEAFSKLRMMSPGLNTNTGGEDVLSLNHSQTITSAMPSTISAVHLANLTPRPDTNTPRPNDTTPRPGPGKRLTRVQDLALHTVGPRQTCSPMPMVHEPAKSPKTLHKAQSSIDLTQFSNLDQLDSSFHPLTTHGNTRVTTYSPTFTDYVDYGNVPTIPYPDNHFFHSSVAGSNPILGPGRSEGFDESSASPGIGIMERDPTNAVAGMTNTSIWVQELNNADQSFSSTFDINGFLANEEILESYEDGSCASSLASSTASMEFTNDRVAYNTGDVDKLIAVHGPPTHEFGPFSSRCQSYTSQLLPLESQSMSMTSSSSQVQELIRSNRFLEPLDANSSHVSSDLKIPMSIQSSHNPQSSQSHSYSELLLDFINHERLDQNTLCSSVNPGSAADLNSPTTSS